MNLFLSYIKTTKPRVTLDVRRHLKSVVNVVYKYNINNWTYNTAIAMYEYKHSYVPVIPRSPRVGTQNNIYELNGSSAEVIEVFSRKNNKIKVIIKKATYLIIKQLKY